MIRAEVDTHALDAALSRYARGAADVADTVTRDTATRVAAQTRATVPRRTGRLAGSVTTGTVDGGARVSMSTPYAGYIEHGSHSGHGYSATGRYLGAAAVASESEMARSAERALEALGRAL